jgi:hypothetical protein
MTEPHLSELRCQAGDRVTVSKGGQPRQQLRDTDIFEAKTVSNGIHLRRNTTFLGFPVNFRCGSEYGNNSE